MKLSEILLLLTLFAISTTITMLMFEYYVVAGVAYGVALMLAFSAILLKYIWKR